MKRGRSDKRSESHCDAGPPAGFAVNGDVRVMDLRNVFYNSKAKAGSACFAGPAFVDTVESFKDPLLLIFRDTDAGVLYREERVIILQAGPDQNGSVFTIVLDGILDEVFDEFLQEVPVSGKYSGISLTGKREIAGLGADREVSAAFLSQRSQIQGCEFPGKFIVVEFRQSNDVVDQREKTVRIMADEKNP